MERSLNTDEDMYFNIEWRDYIKTEPFLPSEKVTEYINISRPLSGAFHTDSLGKKQI